MPVADDGFAFAQRFGERQAQTDADVFDRVVGVDFQVAGCFYLEVKEPVDGERVSMWSRKGTPVLSSALPVPSSAISAEI